MKIKKIELLDKNNKTLFSDKIINIPICEKIVLDFSIEYYKDPEPCFIHRTAVINIILDKLLSYLEETLTGENKELLWENIPQKIVEPIDIEEEIYKVVIN